MILLSVLDSSLDHCARGCAYSRQLEIPEDTTRLASHDASVADLCRTGVAVHLRQLQLGLGAGSGGELRVADDVAQRLPVWEKQGFSIRRLFRGNTTSFETSPWSSPF